MTDKTLNLDCLKTSPIGKSPSSFTNLAIHSPDWQMNRSDANWHLTCFEASSIANPTSSIGNRTDWQYNCDICITAVYLAI